MSWRTLWQSARRWFQGDLRPGHVQSEFVREGLRWPVRIRPRPPRSQPAKIDRRRSRQLKKQKKTKGRKRKTDRRTLNVQRRTRLRLSCGGQASNTETQDGYRQEGIK